MIEAVIFDMDGILIDSEPLWRKVEVKIFNEIGVPITEEILVQTMGKRIDEAVAFWHRKYRWEHPSQEMVVERILDGVIQTVKKEGKRMDGVGTAIDFVKSKVKQIGLASGSPKRLIDATLEALKLTQTFSVIHSAEFEKRGKPHPDVYLTAANQLGVSASHCLAIEDSPNGVASAKAAGMKCLAIPDPLSTDDPKLKQADLHLSSLSDFSDDAWQKLSK